MSMHKRLCCALFVCLCLLAVSLSTSARLTAFADDVNTRYQITASDFVAKYDNIPAEFLGTDGEYHSTTFRVYSSLNGAQSAGLCYYPNGQSFNTAQMPMVWLYSTDVIYNDFTNNAAWEVEKIILHLNLHISNCSFMRFGICGYSESMNGFYNLPHAAVAPYNSFTYHIPSTDYSESVYLGCYDTNYSYPCRLYNNSGSGCIQQWGYQSDTDMYISDLCLSCSTRDSSGYIWCGIYLPFVSQNSVLEDRSAVPSEDVPDWGDGESVGEVSGTIQDDGNGTQNINVTVTTDNSGFVAAILNGLRSLFVPSQDYMNDWHEDIETSFSEHLGGVSEAISLIDEQADYLRAATSADYIYFPELTLPIGSNGFSSGVETIGADYTLIQGQQVELRPARTGKLKILWDFLEFAVDAVCVLAVINMLQTKYEIFLNPDGEVIDYDR